ncbi:MAG: hypothetical protein CR986_09750 [Ignavibacteriae bacterium]|nr:MAG: hypothetical protein CR986_09750 [Ignavibacteriota bacterium]
MIILVFLFIFLLFFYLYFLDNISKGINKLNSNQNNCSIQEVSFISVIIPFRNEEDNLKRSVESISSQIFPKDKYEVIYIDDNSDDNSIAILESLEKLNDIKILKSPSSLEDRAHKKKALKFAIDNAKGDIIITTDADCFHGSDWLKTMAATFSSETGFVSGPVQFVARNNLFQKLQELEFSGLILVGAGLIGIEQPIICNAANLGFRKNVFDFVGGYEDNLNISSGDDEFLMQKINKNTNYKVNFCFNQKATSFTNPNESLAQFYQQRKRWASKGFYYLDNKITVLLILIFFFYLSLPIQLFLGLFSNQIFIYTFLFSLILKFIFEYRILFINSKKLFTKPKFLVFIIAEFFHIPYIIISGIAGTFGNYKWKGRKIKR